MEESSVVLRCFDGSEFRVPVALARRSGLVAEAGAGGDGIVVVEVPDVAGRDVAAVILYWADRAAAAARGSDVAAFDKAYVRGLGHDARVELINAAHHINDTELFDLFSSAFVRLA